MDRKRELERKGTFREKESELIFKMIELCRGEKLLIVKSTDEHCHFLM